MSLTFHGAGVVRVADLALPDDWETIMASAPAARMALAYAHIGSRINPIYVEKGSLRLVAGFVSAAADSILRKERIEVELVSGTPSELEDLRRGYYAQLDGGSEALQ